MQAQKSLAKQSHPNLLESLKHSFSEWSWIFFFFCIDMQPEFFSLNVTFSCFFRGLVRLVPMQQVLQGGPQPPT